MIIYHGSEHIIEKPVYHGGRRNNDYGYGFYCTEYPDMAREWSASPGRAGILNSYEFDTDCLSVLDLNEHSILTWLSVLLQNRVFQLNSPLAREVYSYLIEEFGIDYGSYDVITGYRADDSYFSFAQDFINGTISVTQLRQAMQLGNMGNQIVLISRGSYDHIKYTGYEEVDSNIWYPRRKSRDDKARKDYYSADKYRYIRGDIYITRIIDEGMKKEDVRLQ
ncbi:MAG: DUF3990 domain-containing protein [Lachnospiraceae bacterium]|nr:DUF3990 domain-containing protein [Lachnospiraceae bacterium]